MEYFEHVPSLGLWFTSYAQHPEMKGAHILDVLLVVALLTMAAIPAAQLLKTHGKLSIFAKISTVMIACLGVNFLYASIFPSNGPAPLVTFLSELTSKTAGDQSFHVSPISLGFAVLIGALAVESSTRRSNKLESNKTSRHES